MESARQLAGNPEMPVRGPGRLVSGWWLNRGAPEMANPVEPNLGPAKLQNVDLSGQNFQGKLLSGADFRGAILRRANFNGADLSEANLCNTDLTGAFLIGANLRGAVLIAAHLTEANLSKADLRCRGLFHADLSKLNLSEANLSNMDLTGANLREANLREATLIEADLTEANLSGARLRGASLKSARLVETNLRDAELTGCRVYGASVWGIKLSEVTKQQNLIITNDGDPEVTVDNIEVAQFVHLLLKNAKIRDVIDTIGRKGVLLLGRFTGGRIAVLERLREELRNRGFLPMVFNFERPETKDFTETIRTLAGLSRFIIADITNPRSTPLELQATVPEYMVPFVPIIEQGEEPFAMFKDLWVKHGLWVLDPISYASVEQLAQGLDQGIIKPALARFDELTKKKAEEMPVRSMGDIIAAIPPVYFADRL
jgi:uncharacterized protein YjbI with pentapeptide repeats